MTIFGTFKVSGKVATTTKGGTKWRVKIEDEFDNKISLDVTESEFESYEVEDVVNLRKFLAQITLDKPLEQKPLIEIDKKGG